VMYSRYHYYAGAEEPIVLEVSSEEEAETGIHSPRYILLALLGETLLLLFSGLLFKPQPRPKKKEKGWHVNRTRLLVWIRMGMQPKMRFAPLRLFDYRTPRSL